jgi:hypothetical protein
MMMKIAIDCRYLGMSGIGRFLEGVLQNLPFENEYVLIGNGDKIKSNLAEKLNYQLIEYNQSPFSLKGLFRMGKYTKG